jgi:hypothetical protein
MKEKCNNCYLFYEFPALQGKRFKIRAKNCIHFSKNKDNTCKNFDKISN